MVTPWVYLLARESRASAVIYIRVHYRWVRTGPLPGGSSAVWVVPSLKLLPQKRVHYRGGGVTVAPAMAAQWPKLASELVQTGPPSRGGVACRLGSFIIKTASSKKNLLVNLGF